MRSVVGEPKHAKVMVGATESGTYVGERAEEYRGVLRLRYPVDHGKVRRWEDMAQVWTHMYASLQGVESHVHPVLLTEPPCNPRRVRERAAEVFFEQFNVPAFYVSMQAVLSLYASGQTTGLVVDSGDGVTHVVPVFRGFALSNAVQRIDLGGRDVTERLRALLRTSGYDFRTSAELEIVRAIKEKVCYVASDPVAEEDSLILPEKYEKVNLRYRLPDNNVIEVGAERFRAPEILFSPELIGEEYPGVHKLVMNAIQKTDTDLRREFYQSIIVSGGGTLLNGFGQRLYDEVCRLAPKDTKIKIVAPKERIFSTWIGGSIVAALSSFQKMWVTRAQWDEDHRAALARMDHF